MTTPHKAPATQAPAIYPDPEHPGQLTPLSPSFDQHRLPRKGEQVFFLPEGQPSLPAIVVHTNPAGGDDTVARTVGLVVFGWNSQAATIVLNVTRQYTDQQQTPLAYVFPGEPGANR